MNTTLTSSGSLQVVGGVGISGNIAMGGALKMTAGTVDFQAASTGITWNASGSTIVYRLMRDASNNMLFDVQNGTASSYINMNITANTTTTTTGALVITGGVGIAKDLRVGGTIYGTLSGALQDTAIIYYTGKWFHDTSGNNGMTFGFYKLGKLCTMFLSAQDVPDFGTPATVGTASAFIPSGYRPSITTDMTLTIKYNGTSVYQVVRFDVSTTGYIHISTIDGSLFTSGDVMLPYLTISYIWA